MHFTHPPRHFTRQGTTLKPGDVVKGVVQSVQSYGIFVDLLPAGEGISGLLHVSEISHQRVVKVEKLFREGDRVTVSGG